MKWRRRATFETKTHKRSGSRFINALGDFLAVEIRFLLEMESLQVSGTDIGFCTSLIDSKTAEKLVENVSRNVRVWTPQ